MTESIAAQMNSNIENYYEQGRGATTDGLRGATIDGSLDDDVIEVKGDAYKRQKKEGKKVQSSNQRVTSRAVDPDSDLVEIEKKRHELLAKLRGIKGTG